jgi:hypothetical protein
MAKSSKATKSPKSAKADNVINYRDAETGKYTTKNYAEKNPKTTVKETDKRTSSAKNKS